VALSRAILVASRSIFSLFSPDDLLPAGGAGVPLGAGKV
jgi:hypothetical protein